MLLYFERMPTEYKRVNLVSDYCSRCAGFVLAQNDIYVLVLSYNHRTTPQHKYLALVSTTVETDDPHSELAPGLGLLGEIQESFLSIDDVFEPIGDGRKERVYISRSYDATTHFESTMDDVLDLYKRIFGTDLVMKTGGEAAGSSS